MSLRALLASLLFGLAFMVGSAVVTGDARAAVHIRVDLTTQSMQVVSDSGAAYLWPVSTARSGYVTPRGTYGVKRLERIHYSRKYHNSPMPHSIFFRGGYAIHGTYATGSLGRAASHGCVRISPANAALLYRMVQAEGASITITGSAPGSTRYAKAGGHHHRTMVASRRLQLRPTAYAPVEAPSYEQWLADPSGLGY